MDAGDWDERYADAAPVWSTDANQFVKAALASLTPGHALDLAAGEGRNAIWLASLGWTVQAVDFSRVGLDKGRTIAEGRGLGDRIEWICADATTYQPPQAYDACVIAYLQIPDSERRAAVRVGFDALQPGGTFCLVAHDSTNLTAGTGGPQDPRVLMTAEDVLADLAGRAFETVTAERVARQVAEGHGEEPARTAYDCLVVLRKRIS